MEFLKESHINYLKSCLNELPDAYISAETSLCSLLYFAVIGLDMLGQSPIEYRDKVIDYVYSLQLASKDDMVSCESCGFIGSHFLAHRTISQSSSSSLLCVETNPPNDSNIKFTGSSSRVDFASGHIAMTYTALAILHTLGDDFTRLDQESLLTGVRSLQRPDGSFSATIDGGECDMRFIYCACAISTFLDDWSAIDQFTATSYIKSCITYEGGFGLTPGAEAQGGSTYCAVASLKLMGRLDQLKAADTKNLIYWCTQRQVFGYQGRSNKEADSCYSFWIGATLDLLGLFALTDVTTTKDFLLQACQYEEAYGGFCKTPDAYPDLLHTFYSLSWLSMEGSLRLRRIDSSLGICRK